MSTLNVQKMVLEFEDGGWAIPVEPWQVAECLKAHQSTRTGEGWVHFATRNQGNDPFARGGDENGLMNPGDGGTRIRASDVMTALRSGKYEFSEVKYESWYSMPRSYTEYIEGYARHI